MHDRRPPSGGRRASSTAQKGCAGIAGGGTNSPKVSARRRRQRGRGHEDEAADLVGPDTGLKALTDRIASPEPLDAPSVRTLQRTAGNQAVLRQLGEGQPLDATTRSRMEGVFGTSFAGVRTHAGPEGARLAQSENTAAFAVGEHIVLGEGRREPGTLEGDVLLAHELAHVAPAARRRAGAAGDVAVGRANERARAQREPLGPRRGVGVVGRSAAERDARAQVRRSAVEVLHRRRRWPSADPSRATPATPSPTRSPSTSTSPSAGCRSRATARTSRSAAASAAPTAASRSSTGSRATSATRPTPCRRIAVWRVPLVGGRFKMILPFVASIDAGVGPHDHDQGGRRDALQHRVLDRRGGLSARPRPLGRPDRSRGRPGAPGARLARRARVRGRGGAARGADRASGGCRSRRRPGSFPRACS